jgi:pimeloyl-ACP methyl ester carboxylesterase
MNKDFVFDCATAPLKENTTSKGNVYFMHGNDGKYSKAMWALTMETLAGEGYSTLACDQRGYSPGASPYNESYYNYDLLVEDIFAIADTYFGVGGQFHVVAHDQGGRVGWHAIALGEPARQRFLSYTAQAEAHADVFSDALYGPDPDPVQQTNFMYVWDFTLPGENTVAYDGAIQHNLCGKVGYKTTKECQTALWWYTGAVQSGNLALQPKEAFGVIGQSIGIPDSYVEEHAVYPLTGVPQTTKVGNVTEFPVLYQCGSSDTADLCTDRYRDGSAAYVKEFSYYRATTCGHDLTSPSECGEYQQVIEAIVTLVKSVKPVNATVYKYKK